ncbi:FAS1-like dehydratase domain-containing protein [Halomonas binhaiensis]|uniref:MaoC family dehydratase N-terminal domain-containing protein n=1 Tax=Halomonas binhaiensis TaxID=2562282 RepID=A0A856QST7_9GAMM|nr:MaoC family dehydratase N-terminal domain-containing protein [Halomonas binhaiensis]QEM82976.2 MaoC family dehydratase N-terminal domain-containing protein [Halomonas binhaiensis]
MKIDSWVGNQEVSRDVIASTLVYRIATTFCEESPRPGEALPHLWHWAFFQEPVVESQLGDDGHPARGLFLPPIEGRNRMWAGGRVNFLEPLRVDAPAERRSTITNVQEKQGRNGDLLFVTVEHTYVQNDILCIREEQDIVYREPSPPKLRSTLPVPSTSWQDNIQPSPVMLFRYSAVTFNGHRIHYDQPYVTEREGYPGLVVHGPMIATLLLRSFTRRHPDKIPRYFSYRGLRPLFANTGFHIGGVERTDQQFSLWAFNDDGPAHQAEIQYQEQR